MTGGELKTFVEGIIDDEIEVTLFYTLLNIAKNKIEDLVEWEVLKTWDRSLLWNTGDTYLTPKSLQSNFKSTYANGVIILGEDNFYFPVPYKDIYKYRNFSNKYTIDYLNNKLYIIGSEANQYTINIPYLINTDDITDSTSWSFPSRFHPLLGLEVAAYYTSGVDADDIYARMSPAHRLAAKEIKDSMVKWNTRLALMAMDNSSSPFVAGDENPVNRLGADIINS